MSKQTIEQIERNDKRRYRLNLWRAIGLVLFVGGVLAQMIIPEDIPFWHHFAIFVYWIGCVLTIVANTVFIGLEAKIKREPELNNALNNEMFTHYTLKSTQWGYIAMMAVGIAMGATTWLGRVDIRGEVCCLAIIFAGAVAQTVALSVYDRSK